MDDIGLLFTIASFSSLDGRTNDLAFGTLPYFERQQYVVLWVGSNLRRVSQTRPFCGEAIFYCRSTPVGT